VTSRDSSRRLRAPLALWTLAAVGRWLLGCTAEAHGEEAPASLREFPGARGASEQPAAPAPSAAIPAAPAVPTILLSAVGDCTLGDPAGAERAPGSFHKTFEDGDYARPFSGVASILGKDDLTIANLEGTLTTEGCRRDVTFAFRGKPEFAKMLALGSVDVVSMANNHSADCGPRGVVQTRESLTQEKIGHFGLGVVDTRTVNGIEVKNLGYTGGRLEVREQVKKDVAAQKKPNTLVIVSFHWGIEGEHTATDVQQKLGRAAIDAGADLVLGHHPHVLQGIEEYKGKKIVYSLGNFVFGGNAQPGEMTSMIYQARFELRDGSVTPVSDGVVPVFVSGNRAQNDFRPVLIDGPEKEKALAEIASYDKLVPSR
jgi:poly-gamma-glutamate synthesis protein (capsule biosynthesis protein)